MMLWALFWAPLGLLAEREGVCVVCVQYVCCHFLVFQWEPGSEPPGGRDLGRYQRTPQAGRSLTVDALRFGATGFLSLSASALKEARILSRGPSFPASNNACWRWEHRTLWHAVGPLVVCVGPQNVRDFVSIGKMSREQRPDWPRNANRRGVLFFLLAMPQLQGRPFFAFSLFGFPCCCLDLIMLPASCFLLSPANGFFCFFPSLQAY